MCINTFISIQDFHCSLRGIYIIFSLGWGYATAAIPGVPAVGWDIIFSDVVAMKVFGRHRVSPLKKTLYVYKRASSVTRGVTREIFSFSVHLHLVVDFKLLISCFWCLGHLKEYLWRSRLSWEPTGLFPGGWRMTPVRFSPRFLHYWYNHPILRKVNSVTVLVCVDLLHRRSESGEELLNKADQLQLEIHVILTQVFNR